MDKRLRNVQQADLTESRVNDDFVYWLRTTGSNILVVVLLLAAVAMGLQWYWQKKEKERDDAWTEVATVSLPEALIEIADKHRDGKSAIPMYAELEAADRYSRALLTGKRFDREATALDANLTPEVRAEWAKEADRLYASVAAATANPTTVGARVFHVSALFGRAALAEDAGNYGTAQEYLSKIQDIVKDSDHAGLKPLVEARIASLGKLTSNITFQPRPAPPGTGLALPSTEVKEGVQPNGEIIQKVPGGTVTLRPVDPSQLQGMPTPGEERAPPLSLDPNAPKAPPPAAPPK